MRSQRNYRRMEAVRYPFADLDLALAGACGGECQRRVRRGTSTTLSGQRRYVDRRGGCVCQVRRRWIATHTIVRARTVPARHTGRTEYTGEFLSGARRSGMRIDRDSGSRIRASSDNSERQVDVTDSHLQGRAATRDLIPRMARDRRRDSRDLPGVPARFTEQSWTGRYSWYRFGRSEWRALWRAPQESGSYTTRRGLR